MPKSYSVTGEVATTHILRPESADRVSISQFYEYAPAVGPCSRDGDVYIFMKLVERTQSSVG